MKKVALFAVVILVSLSLKAEYLYLKDGQVIQGKIIAEDGSGYTVQTKYQTKRITRDEVLRIMYGERKLEKIFLLMNDGASIAGYKVDEDAEKVIVREKEDSPEERNISKKDIKQMSGSEIVPLDPSIIFRAGYFMPLNSRGAKLKPAIMITAGSGINFQYINNTRVNIEIGYVKNLSENKNLYMRFIPITVVGNYYINISKFQLVPRIALGGVILDFYDGETTTTREFAFAAGAGLALSYEIVERKIYAELGGDYLMVADKKGKLNCVSGSVGVSYRF